MKFQPSAIAATNMSGKSGGTVATITNIFRRKSNPRQPRTPKQTAAKAIITSLSTTWGTLSAEEQDSWTAAAPGQVTFKNGEVKRQSGIDLFIKTNMPIAIFGNDTPLITSLPVQVAQPPADTLVGIQGSTGTEEGNFYFSLSLISYLNLVPTDPWIPNYHWTGWIKPSRYSFPAAKRYLHRDNINSNSAGAFIYFGSSFATEPAPWTAGLKMQWTEEYVNKNTGQKYIVATREVTVEDFVIEPDPAGTDIIFSTGETTVDGDDIYYDATFHNLNENFDWETWEPYIFWTGWQPNPLTVGSPLIIQIPNTAVEETDEEFATIHFGPDEGMAQMPENIGDEAEIMFGLRNKTTGEIQGTFQTIIQVAAP